MTDTRVAILLGLLVVLAPSVARATDVALEDRTRAQEAIERVAYSHQLSCTSFPSEVVPPRPVLHRNVAEQWIDDATEPAPGVGGKVWRAREAIRDRLR